jgi:hypothetical protein
LHVASLNDYELEFTIAERGVEKCGILVNPINLGNRRAKVENFLFGELELLI